MQLLCFALSLAVIQYMDHAGKAHDHGKQNSTAKPAAGKARIHSKPSQRGKNHKDDGYNGSEFAHINTPVSLSTSTYLLLQVYQETTKKSTARQGACARCIQFAAAGSTAPLPGIQWGCGGDTPNGRVLFRDPVLAGTAAHRAQSHAAGTRRLRAGNPPARRAGSAVYGGRGLAACPTAAARGTNRPCHRPAHAAQLLCRPLPGLRLCL